MINRLTGRLSEEQRIVALQILRFAITGGLVTALSLVVYAAIAVWHHGAPQLANFLAYAVAAATGYVMHSRWSFRGHGSRDNTARTTTRFAAVSLISYALNSFWVWLFTHPLGFAAQWPMLPMLFVTPGVTFLLNRKWVFA